MNYGGSPDQSGDDAQAVKLRAAQIPPSNTASTPGALVIWPAAVHGATVIHEDIVVLPAVAVLAGWRAPSVGDQLAPPLSPAPRFHGCAPAGTSGPIRDCMHHRPFDGREIAHAVLAEAGAAKHVSGMEGPVLSHQGLQPVLQFGGQRFS